MRAQGVALARREVEERLERLFADTGDQPQVVLSSVHKAKGLEWDRVFLLRSSFVRKGLGQQAPGTQKPADDQERNIQYVAITRAKKSLVWAEEVRGEGRG